MPSGAMAWGWSGMPHPDVGHFDVLAQSGGSRPDAFEPRRAYVNSKLCNLWFAYELARRIAAAKLTSRDHPLSVNAYEPGLVPGSGLAREYPPALRWLWLRVLPAVARVATRLTPTINTADAAGDALARLVLDPALERISGKYFPSHARWGEAPSSDASPATSPNSRTDRPPRPTRPTTAPPPDSPRSRTRCTGSGCSRSRTACQHSACHC